MNNEWFTLTASLVALFLTARAALAACPPNAIARCSLFFGYLALHYLSAGLARSYAQPEHFTIVCGIMEIPGALMLAWSLRWCAVGTWKMRPIASTTPPKDEFAGPFFSDSHSSEDAADLRNSVPSHRTDWRYAVGPVRPTDMTVLMESCGGDSDRRLDARLRVGNVHGTLTALSKELDGMECMLLDFSAGGGRLLTRAPLPAGSLVKLDLPEMLLIGEVRYCRAAMDGLQMLGIKFEAKVDRSKLRSVMEVIRPASGRVRRGNLEKSALPDSSSSG